MSINTLHKGDDDDDDNNNNNVMKGKNEKLKLFLSTPWKDVGAVDV